GDAGPAAGREPPRPRCRQRPSRPLFGIEIAVVALGGVTRFGSFPDADDGSQGIERVGVGQVDRDADGRPFRKRHRLFGAEHAFLPDSLDNDGHSIPFWPFPHGTPSYRISGESAKFPGPAAGVAGVTSPWPWSGFRVSQRQNGLKPPPDSIPRL